jgi:thiazole synthase ThiGH ThiG subunit
MNMIHIKARHAPSRFFRGTPQYIDLKQLADIEARFRILCREAIRQYRAMRRSVDDIDDLLECHYRSIEITLSRRRAEDAVRLYALLRRDMRRSVEKYIKAARKTKF